MLARLKYLIPVLATLALPSVADAATVQVNITSSNVDPAACGVGAQTPCKTIPLGAARAQSMGSADQIVVAPGTYTDLVNIVGQGDSLVGSGSCDQATTCTIIQPVAGAQDAVTSTVNNDNGSIIGVRIKAATLNSRIGLLMEGDNATVRDVAVEMDAPGNTKAALRLTGGGDVVVDRTTVTTNGDGEGIYALGAMNSFTFTDSSVKTATDFPLLLGDVASTVVRRSTIQENASPGPNGILIAADDPGPVRVESSLLIGGTVGVSVGAPLTVVGSTIDTGVRGDNDGSAIGTDRADAGELTTARDSLLVGSLYTTGGQPLSCSTSVVGAIFGSNAPSCVSGTAGNTSAAPTDLFANVAGGDYRLKPGSPAVDSASATALAAGESTDISGNARVLDGNGDCAAVRDRGAYELTGFAVACPQGGGGGQQGGGGGATTTARDLIKPALTRFTAGRTRLVFRLSESGNVAVTVERKGRKRRKTVYRRMGTFAVRNAQAGVNRPKVPARLAKKLKAPATYRVTIAATDAAGNRSARVRDSFTVKLPKKKRKRG